MTLQQMGMKWAPGAQSTNWVNNVANYLGVNPNSTIGSILLGSPQAASSAAGSSTSSTQGGGILGELQDYWKMLSNPGQYVADNAGNTLTGLLFSSRLIFLVVGLMLIAAGLFSMRQVQTVIKVVGRTAASAAELAA